VAWSVLRSRVGSQGTQPRAGPQVLDGRGVEPVRVEETERHTSAWLQGAVAQQACVRRTLETTNDTRGGRSAARGRWTPRGARGTIRTRPSGFFISPGEEVDPTEHTRGPHIGGRIGPAGQSANEDDLKPPAGTAQAGGAADHVGTKKLGATARAKDLTAVRRHGPRTQGVQPVAPVQGGGHTQVDENQRQHREREDEAVLEGRAAEKQV